MKARFLVLAALVLGLASCQTEPEGLNVNVGGEQETYVTVSLPETTRANSALGAFDNVVASDEYTIRYIFQVFYGDNESLATRQVIYTDNDRVSFPVRLVPNRHYNFVVWADVVPQGGKTMNTIVDYDVAADYHYYTADLKNIQIIDVDGVHEWEEMDETRDAFTGQYDTAVDGDKTPYNGAKSINFTLTRPFAKLRVITTDMEQLNDLVIKPTSAEVVYTTDLYSSFNAFAGAVNTATTDKTHETFVIKAYEDNVDNKSKVLFTDYLFAADQDEVVNFTLAVYDQNDVIIGKTINFNTPIPARRNYLTTISGNILTDGNKIEVTVTDEFANAGTSTNAPYYQETISSVAELLAAINANNGEYILISDLDVNGVTTSALAATRAAGAGTTINLNGYTIKLQKDIVIPEGNTLIINNDPVDNAGDKLGAVENAGGKLVNYGTLNIEGGAFGANTIVNNGTANVSGGDFADNAIVNNGSVSVEGDNSGEEDRIIENGTNAVVSNIVYTDEELQAALDEGKVDEIIFGADLVGEVTISQREGVNVYINGAGKKFDGVLYIHGNARSTGAETVKIANINFESESAKYFIHANYQTEPERYAHNVTIEDCTFTSLADDNSVAVCGASFRQAYNVTIKNCTANNTFYLAWFSGCYNVAIEGCEAYNNYEGITLGRGSTTSIKNSKINAELYGVRIESVSSGVETHNVTIENCELNAFIPVSVRSLTTGKFNLALQGVNKLTRGGLYDIALCSNEYKEGVAAKAPTCEWAISGADNFIVFPREYAVNSVEQIAEALTLKSKVLFAADIEGDVYIAQQENFNVVIDGRGYKFDGTFTIDGNNRSDGEESVTFKNINFNAENATGDKNFIYAPHSIGNRENLYAHNIIVDQCTFTGGETVVGVRAEQTYGVTIKNSTFTGMHSIGQIKSANKFTHLEKVTAECLGGVNFNNKAIDVVLDGCEITATDTDGYCVRTDHTAGSSLTIKNSTLTGYCPIVLRSCSDQASIKLENNTLVKGGFYDINVKSGVMPQNEGIEDYIVYPREVYVAPGFYQTSNGYTIKNAAENSTITLADNVNGTISIKKVKDITIEGNENTNVRFVTTADSKLENVTIKGAEFEFVTGAGQKNGAFVVIDAAAQIDNLVIEGCNIVGDGNKSSYGIYGQNPNASIVVKNCNFANVGYAIQTITGGGYKSLTVNECKFDSIVSWAIIPQYGYTGDLTINNCEFNNSKGGLVKTGAFNGTFTFTNNALTNCTGHDGKDSKWFEVNASAATKVVSGNVKDGVEWVPGTAQGLN